MTRAVAEEVSEEEAWAAAWAQVVSGADEMDPLAGEETLHHGWKGAGKHDEGKSQAEWKGWKGSAAKGEWSSRHSTRAKESWPKVGIVRDDWLEDRRVEEDASWTSSRTLSAKLREYRSDADLHKYNDFCTKCGITGKVVAKIRGMMQTMARSDLDKLCSPDEIENIRSAHNPPGMAINRIRVIERSAGRPTEMADRVADAKGTGRVRPSSCIDSWADWEEGYDEWAYDSRGSGYPPGRESYGYAEYDDTDWWSAPRDRWLDDPGRKWHSAPREEWPGELPVRERGAKDKGKAWPSRHSSASAVSTSKQSPEDWKWSATPGNTSRGYAGERRQQQKLEGRSAKGEGKGRARASSPSKTWAPKQRPERAETSDHVSSRKPGSLSTNKQTRQRPQSDNLETWLANWTHDDED
eukprot:TRINITY_DN27688_c0_g1_i1.p1 TRINITY_DN27688_c0_g1~~TRINITY_DN27688_c0_g1_i1.p1  ORF type:complete len:410 (-),score=86.26 TRINITY_DN27688_c0_g1_i1:91-1320(-)